MTEEILKKAKKEYIKTPIPDYLVQSGWADLSVRLSLREGYLLGIAFRWGLAFATVILLILGSVVGAAQAAKPQDKLYPVKILADNVFAKVTGKYEFKVQRRAGELIDLSKNSPEEIDKASKQYQKTLDETKKEAEKLGKQNDLKQILEDQENKFKWEIEKNPKSRGQLEEIIRQTERAKGEIRGEKIENNNSSRGSGDNHR